MATHRELLGIENCHWSRGFSRFPAKASTPAQNFAISTCVLLVACASLLMGCGANSPTCLLYTCDAADDLLCVDLGGRRIIKKKILTIMNLFLLSFITRHNGFLLDDSSSRLLPTLCPYTPPTFSN